jgi:hypothetical protein
VKSTARLKGQMLGYATRISVGVTTFVNPYLESELASGFYVRRQMRTYISATFLHFSPSPPVTKIVLSFKLSTVSEPSTSCLNGVCDWTKFSSVRGTPSFLLSSATRVLSCFPPPLVSRMKGISLLCRYSSAVEAPGSGAEDRRSTPSMLRAQTGQLPAHSGR